MDYNEKIETERQAIADMILKQIESEKLSWDKGWFALNETPHNAKTEKGYKGTNLLILYFKSLMKKYADSRWLTFNQAKEIGAKVKSGEKATVVFHWNEYDRKTKEPFEDKTLSGMSREQQLQYKKDNVYYSIKYHNVFNAQQCEHMPERVKHEMSARERENQNKLIENVILNSSAPVLHDGKSDAFYDIINDTIHLPKIEDFKSMQDYYATVLHEIAHSTGHKDRLNRFNADVESKADYAMEELRAELSSMFMQAELGISLDGAHFANHSAYVQHYASIIKNDKNELFSAIKAAGDIATYINEHYAVQEKNIENTKKNKHVPEAKQAKVAQERLEELQHNLDEETNDEETQEWRDYLSDEEEKLVKSWDKENAVAFEKLLRLNIEAEENSENVCEKAIGLAMKNIEYAKLAESEYEKNSSNAQKYEELIIQTSEQFKASAFEFAAYIRRVGNTEYDKVANAQWVYGIFLESPEVFINAFKNYSNETKNTKENLLKNERTEDNEQEKYMQIMREDFPKDFAADEEVYENTKENARARNSDLQNKLNKPDKLGKFTSYQQKNLERLAAIEKNTPAEMKALDNWCVYKSFYDKVKETRKKFILKAYEAPEGQKRANFNESSTWTDFETALKYARENKCEGLSFAVKESGLNAIDLDRCKKDGAYSELAERVLKSLPNTYTESSMSGNGLHFFLKDSILEGDKYKNRNKSNSPDIEVFETWGFISMTGDLLSKTSELSSCPSELKDFLHTQLGEKTKAPEVKREYGESSQSDREVIERIQRSKRGDLFNRLYGGADVLGDNSRNDFTMLNMLAFFTNSNAGQMESIFRSSGLYREEKGQKYLDRSIDKAIGTLTKQPNNYTPTVKAVAKARQ